MIATRRYQRFAGMLGVLWCASHAGGDDAAGAPAAQSIGTQRQLFVDDRLIERMESVELRLHSPTPREIVFRFDAPWEGGSSAYVTVLKDGEKYRLYYRGSGRTEREYACVALSDDGVRWTRPTLGLFDVNGSKANNVVWTAKEKAFSEAHAFAPFVDANPAAPPEQRYKAVTITKATPPGESDRRKVLAAMVSADGLRWKRLVDEPIITEGSFDSQNTAFWDTNLKRYVCYLRHGRNGVRAVMRATSADFVHWSKPEWIELGDAPPEHFYTNAIVPYFRSPGLYVGFPMRFVPQRKTIGADRRTIDGTSDAVFISSHDGLHWRRMFLEAFLRPGLDPDNWGEAHGNNTPAWGLVPTGPDEMSLYWCEHYGQARTLIPRLRRGTLRPDGFVSVHAPYGGGEMVTKPLVFAGRRLVLNYATSAVGSVKVELQDAAGRPMPGFALDDADEIYGDEIERVVSWQAGGDVGRFASTPVRLRFVLRDADLYALRFQE